MRASPVAALLLSASLLPSAAQTPPALHGVTPDTIEVPERNLHPLAIAEADITVPSVTAPSTHAIFVTVSYLVSITGDVQDAVAVSGPAAYQQPATDGVKQWKYRPYTVDGDPRPVKSMVVIAFQNGVGKRIEVPPPPPLPGGVIAGGEMEPQVVGTAPQPTGPVRISSDKAAGMLIHKVDPEYPPEAIARIQGTVILHAVISKEGTIERLTVVSGPPMLTGAAIDAVRQWRYRPYLLHGEPVEVETTINVNFTINTPRATGDDQQSQ